MAFIFPSILQNQIDSATFVRTKQKVDFILSSVGKKTQKPKHGKVFVHICHCFAFTNFCQI